MSWKSWWSRSRLHPPGGFPPHPKVYLPQTVASACFWLQACVQSRRYVRHFVNWGMIKMMSWVTWGAKVPKVITGTWWVSLGCHFHVVTKGLVKDVIYQKRWVEVVFLQMFACLPLTPTINCSARWCSWKHDPSLEDFWCETWMIRLFLKNWSIVFKC